MTALRNIELHSELSSDQAFWLTLLNAACDAVSSRPADIIAATTVSRSFPGCSAVERSLLVSLARDVAERSQLAAEIEDEGDRITVRFSRPAPSVSEVGSPSRTAVSRPMAGLSGAIWRRFGHSDCRNIAS